MTLSPLTLPPGRAPASGARTAILALCAWAVLPLAGCATADVDALSPKVSLRDAGSLGLTGANAQAAAMNPVHASWWQAYGDSRLNALVEQATRQNPSLQAVRTRVARAEALMQWAETLNRPQVTAGLDVTHQRYTQKGMVPPPMAGTVQDTGTLQVTVGGELDFFGKNRAALQSALGQARAAEAESQAAQILLQSQVVRTWMRLHAVHGQMQWAQRTLQQRQEMATLVRQRTQAGLDSELELRQAEAGLPEARAQIESLREQWDLTQNALSTLAGQPPDYRAPEPIALASLPSMTLPTAVPSDLLGRRADVAAARWRVEAMVGERDQARAQFYPNINLVAFAGLSSIGLDRLLQAGAVQWGMGPAVRLPVFDGGRLRANLQAKAADLDAAVLSYNATLTDAIKEVLDALATWKSVVAQQAEQRQALELAQKTYALIRSRQEAGMANSLQVLMAETAVIAQHRSALDLQSRLRDAEVSLVRALGGGFHFDLLTKTPS